MASSPRRRRSSSRCSTATTRSRARCARPSGTTRRTTRDEARTSFEQILAREPGFDRGAGRRRGRGWPDGTRRASSQAIVDAYPDSAVARLNLGLALLASGRARRGAASSGARRSSASRTRPAALSAEDLLNPHSPPGRPQFLVEDVPRRLARLSLEERSRRSRRARGDRAGRSDDWILYGSALETIGPPRLGPARLRPRGRGRPRKPRGAGRLRGRRPLRQGRPVGCVLAASARSRRDTRIRRSSVSTWGSCCCGCRSGRGAKAARAGAGAMTRPASTVVRRAGLLARLGARSNRTHSALQYGPYGP